MSRASADAAMNVSKRMTPTRQWLALVATATLSVLLSGCAGESPEHLLAEAKKHLQQQDHKAAIIQLKNALQQDPSLAEARFLLGKSLLRNGDAAGAEIELNKAAELGYDAEALAPEQSRLMLLQGKAEALIKQYDGIAPKDPLLLAALKLNLAVAHISGGDVKTARERIDQALQADAANVEVQLFHTRLLEVEGRAEAALASIEQLLGKHPQNSQAWKLKGDLLMQQGAAAKTEAAEAGLAAYRKAVELDKRNIDAQAAIFQVLLGRQELDAAATQLTQLRAVASNHPQTHFFAARLAFERRDLKTAREEVQALLKQAPDSAAALQLAGAIELRRGGTLAAQSYLQRALNRAPELHSSRLLLARSYLRAGDGKKALETVTPLLEQKLASGESYAIAAEAQLLQGDAKQATELFERAAELNPQDKRSRTALALASIGQGRSEQGFGELRSLAASDAGPLADLALVSAHMRKREFDAALKALDDLQRKQPDSPLAAGLRGRVELLKGNRGKAVEAFQAALKIDPAFFPAAAGLATLAMEDKKPDEAQRVFEAVQAADPGHVQASLALVRLRAGVGAPHEELVERLGKAIKANPGADAPRLMLIGLLQERRQTKQALAAAQEGVSAIADHPDLLAALARAQMAAGDFNQALIAANKAVALQPESPQPYVLLAELYLSNKDSYGASSNLKKALALRADFLPALTLSVALEREVGRLDRARLVTRDIQRLRPQDSSGYELAGDIELLDKSYPAAVAAYRQALERKPTPELSIKLHRSLLAQGRSEEARRMEQQWQGAAVKQPLLIYYLGDLALTQGDFPQALKHYQQVLALQPSNAAASNNVGWLLHRAGQAEALKYVERANALQPNHPAYLDTLAEILAAQGQLERALQAQQAAVGLAPNFHPHRLNLARFYLQAGRKSEAADELKTLAALGDKFSQQAEVKKLQAQL